MKVENMLKIKEEFDYKSLSRKLEIQVDKLIAENERQQKAFDNEVEEVIEQEAVQSAIEVAVPASPTSDAPLPGEAVVPTVEQPIPQNQRPIAQPKSILRRAFNAAKVVVPATTLGVAFTITALTTLPESFFTTA